MKVFPKARPCQHCGEDLPLYADRNKIYHKACAREVKRATANKFYAAHRKQPESCQHCGEPLTPNGFRRQLYHPACAVEAERAAARRRYAAHGKPKQPRKPDTPVDVAPAALPVEPEAIKRFWAWRPTTPGRQRDGQPAQALRLKLAIDRLEDHAFDDVFADSVDFVLSHLRRTAAITFRESENWRVALLETAGAWRVAYERSSPAGRPTLEDARGEIDYDEPVHGSRRALAVVG